MSYGLLGLLIILTAIALVIASVVAYGAFLSLKGWWRLQRAKSCIKRELRSLSDRDLKDIGITRSDISRVARYG